MIVSVFEVIRNDPMGNYMLLDFNNNNNPIPIYKNSENEENDIEETIHNICNRYLPIIMDINKYSQLLHKNLLQIYSLYLFNIIKKSPLKKLDDKENNQKEYENNKHYDNNKFYHNFVNELNNNDSYFLNN